MNQSRAQLIAERDELAATVHRVSELAWVWLEVYADAQNIEGQIFARAARDIKASLDPNARPYIEANR